MGRDIELAVTAADIVAAGVPDDGPVTARRWISGMVSAETADQYLFRLPVLRHRRIIDAPFIDMMTACALLAFGQKEAVLRLARIEGVEVRALPIASRWKSSEWRRNNGRPKLVISPAGLEKLMRARWAHSAPVNPLIQLNAEGREVTEFRPRLRRMPLRSQGSPSPSIGDPPVERPSRPRVPEATNSRGYVNVAVGKGVWARHAPRHPDGRLRRRADGEATAADA